VPDTVPVRCVAAVVMTLACAAACTSGGSGQTPTPTGQASTAPRSVASAGGFSSPAASRARAESLLVTVRVPGPAATVTRPPNRYLSGPASYPSSPYLVSAHRIWTVPWILERTIRWYHRIGRAASSPWDMSHSTRHGRLTSVSLDWSGVSGNDVVVEFVPIAAHQTGIRADAQVIWTPPRPAAEMVPATVTGATVTAYYLPHHVVARRDVGTATARHLGALVNALHRDTRGPHGCLVDFGFRLRITFTAAQGRYVVGEFPACGAVSLTTDGHDQPGLLLSGRLLPATLGAVGLPAHYQPKPRR